MSGNNFITERLIGEFAENYTEKLFYFCLKKTGNSYEAEDLASDIILNILSALDKGTIPTSFSAWIWQIAHNRYSVWADKKHKYTESVIGSDVEAYEIEDENANIENELIHSEDLSLLRRELVFISSDYRNIVVAYYIEDKKIKEIAGSLGLPEGTVKSKLFRARQILKEGMNMAREFGALSYRPENISFIMNGLNGRDGEPWCYLRRALCKNIMLAAYRMPSTAEELAIEVGVALPYIEDELQELTEAALLKKSDNKYETNIFIVSADAQEKINAHLRGIAPELTKATIALQEYEEKCDDENGSVWHEGYQPYEDMKWALLMRAVDTVNFHVLDTYNRSRTELPSANLGAWGHTVRPNGGEWDLLGLEEYHGNRPAFVGLHGCTSNADEMALDAVNFGQYKFNYRNIADKTPVHLTYAEGQALSAVAKGNGAEVNEKILKKLVEYGYLCKDGERYRPTFLVMVKNKLAKKTKAQETEYKRLMYKARDIAMRHYLFCREIICQEIPDFLKDDAYQIEHACANIYTMRGAVLEEALYTGYISYADNDERKMLGAYLII